MASNVGVNVTINNDFRSCCPRILRVMGCCVGKPQDKKIQQVAEKSFSETDSSVIDDCVECEKLPSDEVKDVPQV